MFKYRRLVFSSFIEKKKFDDAHDIYINKFCSKKFPKKNKNDSVLNEFMERSGEMVDLTKFNLE